MRIGFHAAALACALVGSSAQALPIELDIPVNGIGFSTQTGMLYATIPSRAGLTYGNRLIEIDPETGTITHTVFVGSEPNVIAVSPDAAVAYVGLDGAGAVRPVDLATVSAGTQFSLGASPYFGTHYANDIAVMPGSPGTVAVALKVSAVSPSYDGVVVYDDGVPRPVNIGSGGAVDTLGFGSSAGTLYGYNNETTGFDLLRMSVGASGVSVSTVVPSVITGFGVRILTDGDTIYATSGATADGTQMHLIGTYQINDYNNYGYGARLALDTLYDYVQFAVDNTIVAYERETFIPTYVTSTGTSGQVVGAANCGAACLAVAYASDQILIFHDVVRDEIFAGTFD
jgi:hypothetical protein